jgi:hypothetical protein
MRRIFRAAFIAASAIVAAQTVSGQSHGATTSMERGPRAPQKTTIAAPVSVPMTVEGHLPVVEVLVDGEGPFHFAIDTGAGSLAVIARALATRLHFEKSGEAVTADPSGLHAGRRDLVRVPSIALGGVRFEGVEASVADDGRLLGENVDGVLGFPLFHDVLFTLDYPRSELRLEPGSLGAVDGKQILAYDDPHGIPNVEAVAAGQTIRFDVDAGAPGNITFPIASSKTLPISGELELVGHGRTVSNEFRIFGARMAGDFQLGDIVVASPAITFVEILPMAHLGFRFLRDYAVTFDQRQRRIRFVAGKTLPASGGV